jgi:hypothetical protein
MNICEFLHYNDNCPVCGNKLTLYMYVEEKGLWKATEISPGVHRFQQFAAKKDTQYGAEDFMTLFDLGAVHDTRFNSSKLGKDSKTWGLYFFKICGNQGITDNQFDFDINWYDACYHRSSPWYEFKHHPNDQKKWQLEIVNPDHQTLMNRDESFAFKKMDVDGNETVYLLSLDHENKKTKFYRYITTPDERALADFEPKDFALENLPLIKYKLDLEPSHRDKLLEKFETWVTFS